ncbi:transglutaminase family protein [Microbacterium sp. GXF7504]
MPRADRRLSPAAARLPAAAAVWVAVAAAVLPSLRAIQPGTWLPATLVLTAGVLAAATAARALRCPAPIAPLAGVLVWAGALTAVFLRGTAILGVVPTADTVGAAAVLVGQGTEELATGVAPLPATVPVAFLYVAAAGALAVVLDYVVIATRLPLLASVAVVAVGLAPSVAVPAAFDGAQMVLLAVAVLLLLWTEERARRGRDRRLRGGSAAGALAVAAGAMVVAFVATPLLPSPVPQAGVGGGGSVGIDASLRLGEDLRRPEPTEVLTVRSTAGAPQYLRAATLSGFDGRRWRADSTAVTPLEDGFGPLETSDDVGVTEVTTDIRVSRLRSEYLPVPFAATSVEGVDGTWGMQQLNRTVVALEGTTVGQEYRVQSLRAEPSLERIRAASARDADVPSRYFGVPDETPQVVVDTALAVTAGTESDYDAAAALQRWFRSSEFSYSLTAPVADDFDGAGVEAVAEFLEVKEGYCIHYASAFTLMVRALGMPARIVVGYLPGIATGEVVDGQSVYLVTSDLLHAWPEVYFDGIGWVGFEPTNSLGSPPRFTSAGTASGDGSAVTPEQQAPMPTATPGQDRDRGDVPDAAPTAAEAERTARGWLTAGAVALAVLLVLASPAAIAAVRRRRLLRAGGAADAWLFVQETAIDLAIPVPGSDSPRRFAERLRRAGADPAAVDLLVHAVEHAAYAPDDASDRGLSAAAATVRSSLLAAAEGRRRVRSVFVPRSLVLRPPAAAGVGTPERR